MRIAQQLGVFTSLGEAPIIVSAGADESWQLIAIALIGMGAERDLYPAFDLDALRVAEAIDPLHVSAQVAPGTVLLAIVIQTWKATEHLIFVFGAIIPKAFLDERLQANCFLVADLPVRSRRKVQAMPPHFLLAHLNRPRRGLVGARHEARRAGKISVTPLKPRYWKG